MEVTFSTQQLQRICQSAREMRRAYGTTCAQNLMLRLTELRAAPSLEDLRSLGGRCRELDGKRAGQFSVEVSDTRQLVFSPTQSGRRGSGLKWRSVEVIEVIEILELQAQKGGARR
jgi:toxin HigB-1